MNWSQGSCFTIFYNFMSNMNILQASKHEIGISSENVLITRYLHWISLNKSRNLKLFNNHYLPIKCQGYTTVEDSKNDELEGKVVKIPALIRKNHHQYKKYQLFTNLDKVWPFAKQWKAKSTKSFLGKLSSILVICSEYFQCKKRN